MMPTDIEDRPASPAPSFVARVRAIPRRTVVIAVAAVAALVAGGTLVVATNTPPAPPPPGRYFALAGGGSDTTFDVLSAIAREVPELGPIDARLGGPITTKDPRINPGCGTDRPADDAAAVRALAAAQARVRDTGTPACLDFARSTVDLSRSPDLADAGLTFVPFARDAVTFVQRADSPNPRSLKTDALRGIYSCASPGHRPLLPAPGSGLRAVFLAAIGLADGPDFVADHPCVTEDRSNRPGENVGQVLGDPRQIAPYSVAAHLAQTSGAVADVHGTTVLGALDGTAPVMANPAAPGVGIATRYDSLGSRSLTVAQLRTLYSCTASTAAQGRFHLLLPAPGSAVRAEFLRAVGLLDTPDFTTTHPCVAQTDAGGAPISENTGTALANPRDLVPYSVAQYVAQVNRTVPDVHGPAVLLPLDGVATTVPNPAFPTVHDVYDVVPTAALASAPTSTVFVGAGSAVCSRAEVIARLGFLPSPDCGATTVGTPR